MANTFKFGNGIWATKKGSTLAYNDENGNYKPLPFNFERASGATRVNKDGLIEVVSNNKPRIDFKDSADGSLLLEPSRTNLFLYSELSEGTATGGFSYKSPTTTVDTNTTDTTSPKGDNSSSKITTTTSDNVLDFYKDLPTATDDVTYSLFVKKASITDINLEISGVGVSTSTKVDFDLEKVSYGTLGGDVISAFILDYGNDWYRIGITSSNSPTSSAIFRIKIPYTGSFYVWGMQLEQGSYATSYIPTQGSASTRDKDICKGAGNEQVFNDSEGVLYTEISALADDGTSRRISISHANADTNNRVTIEVDETARRIKAFMSSGGATVGSLTAIVGSQTDNNKVAVIYKANTFGIYINGFLFDADYTITSLPIGLLRLQFEGANGSNDFYGKTKQLQYYNTALTDVELEYMTSYRSLNQMVTELNLNAL